MRWLNYHHLFYFHSAAHAGSITAAARRLRIAHSTLSVQIRELGDQLGGPLFEKTGRKLVLTPLGETVLGYADDIFRLGNELLELGEARATAGATLVVGIVPSLPSSLAYRLVEPVVGHGRLVVRSRSYAVLLDELAAGRMHVVLSDAPPEGPLASRAIEADLLGRSRLALYAAPTLLRTLREPFPKCLANAPLIAPAQDLALRRVLDRWFSAQRLRPRVVAEVEDAAMLRTLGARGHGVFPVRLALRAEVEDTLGARLVGVLEDAHESYYALTVGRRVKHPLAAAVVERWRGGTYMPE